ncbi:uncharacterized protein [Periplaneta americana]|uniref:uncharacterized protein isoform X2 n=1 Tax=Periplaneta americana TaxID=6978 RepID=UPI0037E7C861
MPGCTAPNCTNSSQKGFKLYHFPTDKERNSIWVQNCGREQGWKPTKHTCVCEAHFEESQFESHRADGLRKLKPNAVPTIFNHVPPHRNYTRRLKKEDTGSPSKENEKKQSGNSRLEIVSRDEKETEKNAGYSSKNTKVVEEIVKEDDHTYPKLNVKEEKNDEGSRKSATEGIEEVFVNVSIASQHANILKSTVKERRRGRSSLKQEKKDDADWRPDKANRSRKRGRPPGSTNKRGSPVRKSVKVSVSNKDKLVEGDESPVNENRSSSQEECISEEKTQCFVCGKKVDNGTPLHTLTSTTKMYMHQKLHRIVTGEMEFLIEEEGVLCARCTNLLNYMDRIEVELNMLNKAILNCIRKKYGMGIRTSDKENENVLPDMEGGDQEHSGELIGFNLESSREETRSDWINYEGNTTLSVSANIDSLETVAGEEEHTLAETVPLEDIQCRMCRFRTCYKSLMIFHVRQHLKKTYSCDFCNVTLPEGATSWVEEEDADEYTHQDDITEDEVQLGDEVAQNNEALRHTELESSTDVPGSKDILVTLVPESENVSEVVFRVVHQNSLSNKSQEGTEDTGDVEEMIQFPNQRYNESEAKNAPCLPSAKSVNSNSTKIRVLNEMGLIVTQELVKEEDKSGEANKNVSEDPENSQLSYNVVVPGAVSIADESQTFSAESRNTQLLSKCLENSDSCKNVALKEVGVNVVQSPRSKVKSKPMRILNELGVIEVTSVDSADPLLLDLNTEANEMKVNVTPGMMTYSSSDRRVNMSLVDNSSELNNGVFGS